MALFAFVSAAHHRVGPCTYLSMKCHICGEMLHASLYLILSISLTCRTSCHNGTRCPIRLSGSISITKGLSFIFDFRW